MKTKMPKQKCSTWKSVMWKRTRDSDAVDAVYFTGRGRGSGRGKKTTASASTFFYPHVDSWILYSDLFFVFANENWEGGLNKVKHEHVNEYFYRIFLTAYRWRSEVWTIKCPPPHILRIFLFFHYIFPLDAEAFGVDADAEADALEIYRVRHHWL